MSVVSADFGMAHGKPVTVYTMQNKNGMKVEILNYGGIIKSICVPKNGKVTDVVLGYDTIEGYLGDNSCMGALVGRSANRIKNASFTLNGVTYPLEINERGNNLHSSLTKGYHRRVWDSRCESEQNRVIVSLDSPDMDMGFPGNLQVKVTYVLREDNALELHYEAYSDKDTVFNMTNHVYMNLKGHNGGEVLSHDLLIKSCEFTEIGEDGVPTGKRIAAAGTPMDFNRPRKIGDDIDADDEQIRRAGGYDHNWVIAKETSGVEKVAEVYEETTGIRMETFTDLPGLQFYSSNGLEHTEGKEGAVYERRHGFCLETQFFPNSINEPSFPSPVLHADTIFRSTTIYKFL